MSKKPQEDGRGREGGTEDNIRGEMGSIPPYPPFISQGPKKLFCRGSVINGATRSSFTKDHQATQLNN